MRQGNSRLLHADSRNQPFGNTDKGISLRSELAIAVAILLDGKPADAPNSDSDAEAR